MPLFLLAILIGVFFLGHTIPVEYKSILFALSSTIKEILIFILPLIIFCLLFKTAVTLAKQATKLILFILLAVCASNFISTMISYEVGLLVYQFDIALSVPDHSQELKAAWHFALPKLNLNQYAMFSGIILGILGGMKLPKFSHKLAGTLDKYVHLFLKGFIYILPLFILGFAIKLSHDGLMAEIVEHYGKIFATIALAQFGYILFVYLAVNKFNFSKWLTSVKNMLAAAISGFSTMSSAASMPLTILGTERNTKNHDLAKSVIPATVNIHLIGDCFAIPILAFAVLKSFGLAEPSLIEYVVFALYFVLAKFSVAAVPGGGIIVMLPILEHQLGFSGQMSTIITALYILFDPVITSANVLGNGGFAMLMDRALTRFKKMLAY